jgi:hypothetical protein
MPSIGTLSLRIPAQSPSLISLDFPLTTLIDIAGKRKQFLTCTQKTTRAKLEWLRSARLIQGDEKDHLQTCRGFIKIKGLISLLALDYVLLNMLISQVLLINMIMFASYSKHAKVAKQYWFT